MLRPRLLHSSFRCFSSQPASIDNHPNKKLIDVLKTHLADEDASIERNPFKVKAFKSAIDAIAAIERPVTSLRDLKAVRGIGPGILSRLEPHIPEKYYYIPRTEEHAQGHKVNWSNNGLSQEDLGTKDLRNLPGIGPTKAAQLQKAGCRSLQDLVDNPKYQKMLTRLQLLNLRYLAYLNIPVKKEDSATIHKYLKDNIPSAFEVHLAGGCRREPQEHREIDIMLLHPSYDVVPIPTSSAAQKGSSRGTLGIPFLSLNLSESSAPEILGGALNSLCRREFLADELKGADTKWMGFAALPVKNTSGQLEIPSKDKRDYIRVNISLVPHRSKGAGLLALTGDDAFIRHLSDKARRIGLYLNEFGLWKWEGDACRLVCSRTEKDIFEALGMDFVDPTRRNFALLKAAR